MTNEPPSQSRLADLESRLRKARRDDGPGRAQDSEGRSSAIGIGFRLSAELVSAVLIGGGIGWLLDRWLGTTPWCLLGFFLLGVAAGMLNVIRAAKQLNARAAKLAEGVPPAPADDDDD